METELPQFVNGETCWRISKVPDFPTFLRNLPILVPADSVLCLDGTPDDDVEVFLSERPAIYPNKLDQGFLSMRPKLYYIPATSENLQSLADLAEHHAEPEICDHVRVYYKGKAILAWHDVMHDPVDIDSQVDESSVDAFSKKLGTTYES